MNSSFIVTEGRKNMNFRTNLSVKLILVILVDTFVNVSCAPNVHGSRQFNATGDDADEPLVLSSFLPHKDGEARNRSKVILPELPDLDSYAGYFKDQKYKINTFFWYFPAKENPKEAPVVLFVEGTPGKDSLFSLFTQNGPFSVAPNGSLVPRTESWNNKHNLIYMNSVRGLGYTFSDLGDPPLLTSDEINTVLQWALQQFFKMFPWLRKNDFFLSGNYFGSAAVLDIGYLLKTVKINGFPHLKGIILAHGFLAQSNQLKFGEYLSRIRLIDFPGRQDFIQREKSMDDAKPEISYVSFEQLIIGSLSLFNNLTGYANPFHVFKDGIVPNYSDRYFSWIQDSEVRRALHVGNKQFYQFNRQVSFFYENIMNDFPLEYFHELLESSYPVLIYSGNFDILCHPLMADQFWIHSLPQPRDQQYKAAEKKKWFDSQGKLAGYIKRAGNLIKALIINAGYLSSIDQPQRTLELVEKFISGNLL